MLDEVLRQQLYIRYKLYFKVLDKLGRGIMLKPQLEQYIQKFEGCSKSKFDKVIKELVEQKLIRLERTKSASVLSLTNPSLRLLRNAETQAKVSTSSIRTESNLKKSIVKNEYILQTYLEQTNNFGMLISILEETNLLNANCDNLHIAKIILNRAVDTSCDSPAKAEYDYIDAVYKNKLAQLKHSKIEGNQDVRKKDKMVSVNSLQSRHMYITNAESNFEVTYMEMFKPIGYGKFKADMEVLNKYLQAIPSNTITINVVVEKHRINTMKEIIKEWERNKLQYFCLTEVTINTIEIDTIEKYMKGVEISIS